MEAGQYCTFVIHRDGAVSACGKGSYGRLGLGTSSSQPVPSRLTFDQCRAFRHVSSSKGSDGHTLAVTADGRVYSWGDGKLQCDELVHSVCCRNRTRYGSYPYILPSVSLFHQKGIEKPNQTSVNFPQGNSNWCRSDS